MSVKKGLKNDFGTLNPAKRFKGGMGILKDDLGLDKPKPDTTAQDEAMAQARLQQAELDEEENRRRKRLLAAASGVRAFRGSPMFRSAPGNRAGRAAPSRALPSRGTGGAGGSGGTGSGGGGGGGRTNPSKV